MKLNIPAKENTVDPTDQGFSQYLNSWMQWSVQEKQAILIDDWVQVDLRQRQKSHLSDRIQSYAKTNFCDPPRELMQQLQDQQREIIELIDTKVVQGKNELEKLDSSTKQLKNIHVSYRSSRGGVNNFSQLG